MNVLTSYMSKIMKSTNMIGDSNSNKQSSIASSDHEKSGSQSVGPPSGSLAAFSADDATMIKEKLGNLYSAIQEVNEERSGSESTLAGIARTHEKIQQEPSKPQLKSSLRRLYNKALQDCESEAESLQKCLDIIGEIRRTVRNRGRKGGMFNKETSIRRGALMKMLQSSAQTMPLFIPRARKEGAPSLCGCIPAESNEIVTPGDLVAALVKPATTSDATAAADESNWILAEVVSYNSNAGKYEIDDIDEEQKERHTVSRRKVIPLPQMRANPVTNPEALFEKGSLVLALYPQTTCFYQGIVGKVPESSAEDYLVLFEDSSYPEGYSPPLSVPQRYVIQARDSHNNIIKNK